MTIVLIALFCIGVGQQAYTFTQMDSEKTTQDELTAFPSERKSETGSIYFPDDCKETSGVTAFPEKRDSYGISSFDIPDSLVLPVLD